ncbi:MAG TPA: hypothetical protein VGB15_13660 [Longimicrobium sp.]|jgi:hypothetical protein
MCPCRPAALAAALMLAAVLPPPVAAQDRDTTAASRPGWSVDRTMREFARDLGGDVRGYFPTRGDWTWVPTTRHPGGTDRPGIHRFPAAQTDSTIGRGGPLCDAFRSGDYAVLGTLIAPGIDRRGSGEWRRVRGTRFVPQGEPASFPVFVEWRREDGRWVISAFGGETRYAPAAAARPRTPLRLPLPATEPVAAGAPWFVNNEPIMVDGFRLNKYGLPRALAQGEVVRFDSVHGVGVYVEPSARGRPEVVYVVVSRDGMFQPYQSSMGNGC